MIHCAFLVACIITLLSPAGAAMPPYYLLEIGGDQHMEVYPIYVAITTHVIAAIFHVIFFFTASTVIDKFMVKSYNNPWHWVYIVMCDGSSMVGIMLIHGFLNIEIITMVMALFIAVIALCYLQDQYISRESSFNPEISPHTFAIPLYAILVLFISIKATQNIDNKGALRVTIVTLASLGQTAFMFILQRIHSYLHVNYSESTVESASSENDENESESENDLKVIDDRDIDAAVADVRRGIKFELLYYINSILFQMTISWVIINITRSGTTLKEDNYDDY
jgi:hypothetical protein